MYSRIEKHYQDGENAQKEMFYDKNGALLADFDRNTSFLRFSFGAILTADITITGDLYYHHKPQ